MSLYDRVRDDSAEDVIEYHGREGRVGNKKQAEQSEFLYGIYAG